MEKNKMKVYDINIESTHILAKCDIEYDLERVIRRQRKIIQNAIDNDPMFNGYEPVGKIESPRILNLMTYAGIISNTGPMSAVAGSMSQICMEHLVDNGSKHCIIENGGDISLRTNDKINIAIYAGSSIFSNKLGVRLKAKKDGYGICTSSGTVGPSKSFGSTDATIVFSKTSNVADSLATSIGNYGKGDNKEDIVNNAISYADEFREYYDGVLVIKEDLIAKVGHIPKLIEFDL